MKLPKMRGKKKDLRRNLKEKKLWQLICGNGIAEMGGKKIEAICGNVVAEMEGGKNCGN